MATHVVQRGRQPGFTLVELLTVIGVVVVLIAIMIPTIAGVRRSAMQAAELAHQRQVGMVLVSYIDDHNDTFPFFGIPGTDLGEFSFEGSGWSDWYWGATIYWGAYIWDQGYDGHLSWTGPYFRYETPTFEEVRDGPRGNAQSKDQLTHTAFAPPHMWRLDSPQRVEDQNVQRFSLVAYPSNKGILRRWNYAMQPPGGKEYLNPSFLVWFADGHVAPYRLDEMRPSVPFRGWLFGNGNPVAGTEDGLLGRDI